MSRIMLKSKIHKAVVTHSDIDYEGSIEIDSGLMRASDILMSRLRYGTFQMEKDSQLMLYPHKRGQEESA